MKIFMLLSFLIISSMVFISCFHDDCESSMGYNGCITYDDCTNKSDCKEGYFCNIGVGKCYPNPCNKEGFLECGLGKCVIDDYGHGSCECDEGAQFYEYEYDDIKLCVPKCKTNDDCHYENGMNYQYCDTELGNCVFDKPSN